MILLSIIFDLIIILIKLNVQNEPMVYESNTHVVFTGYTYIIHVVLLYIMCDPNWPKQTKGNIYPVDVKTSQLTWFGNSKELAM